MKFLCQKTELKEFGNEELLHICPEFGESIGKAFNSNNVISFTTELSEHLQEMDLYKASLLTNFIGFVCEEKGDTSAGDATESVSQIHTYVNSMLKTCSNRKLLVLQPSRQQGFYATVNDLNNCFHLLFLLEEQVVEKFGAKYGAEKFFADESLVRLTHGEHPQEAWGKSYSTRFMECNYTTANHAAFKNDDSMRMIWGEMPRIIFRPLTDMG